MFRTPHRSLGFCYSRHGRTPGNSNSPLTQTKPHSLGFDAIHYQKISVTFIEKRSSMITVIFLKVLFLNF